MEMRDMEHILKILTLAEKSERIGIVLGPEAGDAELLAAHALKERLGDKASILNTPEYLQDRWSHLFKKERPQKEFALVLNIEENPVKELRYENEGGKLRIFLSPHHELTKDAFELEQHYPVSDMIIALGFASEEKLMRLIATDVPLKDPHALINLSPVSHKEQENAHIPHMWDIGTMKLWGRALLRSYMEEHDSVFWAFLPKEDFQKTNQSDDILPALIADMRHIMRMPPLCVILWQSQQTSTDNVHILISSTDAHVMARLSVVAETPLVDGLLIISGLTNFSEAELEARKLIKQI